MSVIERPSNHPPPLIEEIIASHWGVESLDDENDMCPRCHQYQKRQKQTIVVRWPQVLVLHLKRWKVVTNPVFRRVKINDKVSFDGVLDVGGAGGRYNLRGVVNHHGAAGYGHYTAHVRAYDDQWYFCDDAPGAIPCRVPAAQALQSQAYLLVYERA